MKLFSAFTRLTLALVIAAQGLSFTASAVSFSEIAESPNRALGAPRYSDVAFSPRWRRPKDANDPYETFRDAKAFHATRFDWVYSHDPEWIAECRKRGYWFTGTLNSKMNDIPGIEGRKKGRIRDKNGDRVAAPWMRNWEFPGWWGCVNSPEFREIYLTRAKLLVDGGADAIQMDDPGINHKAVDWGGCFCEHCKTKAAAQGKELSPESMKAFQKASLIEFYDDMRVEIDRYAGRRIPWSSNNYDGATGFPYSLFDYGTAELPHKNGKPESIYRKISEANRQGRQQIYTFVSTSVALNRRVIATAYASGGHVIVPYDVWHKDNPRYFGTPEEYADLYGFVRAMAPYLDGYEDAAAYGPGIEDSRYGPVSPLAVDAADVYAFVRAVPGEKAAPVTIHLVDWRDHPQPFTLKLRSKHLFPDRPVSAHIHAAPPYQKALHSKAAISGDYEQLSQAQSAKLTVNGEYLEIEIPTLAPWGMLVLTHD